MENLTQDTRKGTRPLQKDASCPLLSCPRCWILSLLHREIGKPQDVHCSRCTQGGLWIIISI